MCGHQGYLARTFQDCSGWVGKAQPRSGINSISPSPVPPNAPLPAESQLPCQPASLAPLPSVLYYTVLPSPSRSPP